MTTIPMASEDELPLVDHVPRVRKSCGHKAARALASLVLVLAIAGASVALVRTAPGSTKSVIAFEELASSRKSALALQGNGNLAITVAAGITAGMLPVLQKNLGKQETADIDKLFQGFDIISSNSGGSWFTSLLAFSPSFLNTVQKMGAQPDTSGKVWQAEFLTLQTKYCIINKAWYMPKSAPVCDNGDWVQSVRVLLGNAGGLTNTSLLGRKQVNSWAKDKTWLVCTSVMTPSSEYEKKGVVVQMTMEADGGINYNVFSKGKETVPLFTPAKFSVVLGSGGKSPLPFCSSKKCFGQFAQYKLKVGNQVVTQNSSLLQDTYDGFEQTGKVHLIDVVAGSSAFMAPGVLEGGETATAATVSAIFISDPGAATGASPFTAFQNQLQSKLQTYGPFSETLLKSVAASRVSVLADGAYTDNTGIAQAVGAGASNVTCVVNEISQVWGLFAGEPIANPVPLGNLGEYNYFKIFADQSSVAMKAFASTSKCLQGGVLSWLKSLCFGTVKTHTIQNQWMGVRADVPITLNIIAVDSKLTQDAYPASLFASLIQEITTSLSTASSSTAKPVLQRFFPHALP